MSAIRPSHDRDHRHDPPSEATAARVLLADVDGSARRAVATVLEGIEGVRLVGQVGSREEIALALRRTHADLLVIDDRFLPVHGHTLDRLGPLPSAVRVIVMGMDDSPAFAARARRMGAEAWVAKDRADEDLRALLLAGR